ncbi:MAG TPA: tyrosine-type recombinase/integrase [Kiritimatiellia bacterium]|nr:tyrosine-type recombinase/integrase [Kiritimatiellia bacterium]HRU70308.1 tyrosine-type recombinase/integrase [Kiritimatiellia bacterium]
MGPQPVFGARRFFDYLVSTGNVSDGRPVLTEESFQSFISHLATRLRVAAGTQNQAFAAVLFLYRDVLGVEVGRLEDTVRAKRGQRLPTVLSTDEVQRLSDKMEGAPRLMAELIYGGGLRVMACCRLRVKDVDFGMNQLMVRGGKGDKDRSTLLPERLKPVLRQHLERVRGLYETDRAGKVAGVHMPGALERKLPHASTEWGGAGSSPAADIRQVQELFGHTHVETTMIYTHVAKGLRAPPKSPLDLLG